MFANQNILGRDHVQVCGHFQQQWSGTVTYNAEILNMEMIYQPIIHFEVETSQSSIFKASLWLESMS